MILSSRISGVFEVIGAFLWREGLEQLADCRAEGFNGARGAFSQQVFELGKDLFDGVQVRRVFWQEEQLSAGRANMSWRTALPLWLPRLSMMTMSPGFKVGTRTFST